MIARCFLAAELPERVKERAHELGMKFGGKVVDAENIHITIKFFGEVDPEPIIKRLKFLDNYGPIKIRMNGVGFFPSKRRARVAWIRVISKEFNDLLSLFHESVPHITVARNPKNVEDFDFVDECTIGRITLFKSTLLPSGPVYSRIKTWKL